jgi:hypothetical protein
MRNSDPRIGAFSPRILEFGKARWVRGLVCLAVGAFLPLAAGFPQSQIGNGLPYPPAQPGVIPMNRTANPTADANRLMEDSMNHQNDLKRFELINAARQKQMTSDTTILLQLAHELKAETDKAKPDTLEIRKAELIEKIAHSIQGKMRAIVAN